MKSNKLDLSISDSQLEKELRRTVVKAKRFAAWTKWILVLSVFAVSVTLIVTMWFPVYQVRDDSMKPLLSPGEIIIAQRVQDFESGDIVALYDNQQVHFRRIVGIAGQKVSVNSEGSLKIGDNVLPNVDTAHLGLKIPYQIPAENLFLVTEQKPASVAIGSIASDKIEGKVILRIWPLQDFRIFGIGE